MDKRTKKKDEIDCLFEPLRSRDIPPGPSAELIRQTTRKLRVLSNGSHAQPRTKKEVVMRRFKMLSGSLAMAGLFTLALVLSPNFNGITFADVQAAIATVKSVQYRETRVNGLSQNQIEAGQTETSTTTIPKELVHDNGEEVRRIFISGRYKKRDEQLDRNGNPYFVNINDTSTGETAVLFVPDKRYSLLTTQVTLHQDGTQEERDITKPNLTVDFYSQVAKVPEDAVTELPPKKIEGKPVIGFLVTRRHGRDTWTRKYWVDAKTKLPVQVEISMSSTNPIVSPSTWTQSDFVFGEKLDPALFSTAVPEGYHVDPREDSKKVFGLKVD